MIAHPTAHPTDVHSVKQGRYANVMVRTDVQLVLQEDLALLDNLVLPVNPAL